MFDSIAVVGLGLMGGSICRGLKKISPSTRIFAYGRNPEKFATALRDRIIDRSGPLIPMNLAGTGLVIISTPVASSIGIISSILSNPGLDDSALVIDVGSVKGPILEKIEGSPRARQFIGCHPMTGSDESGYDSSSESLYRNAPVLITPSRWNRSQDIERVTKFWESLGAKVTAVPADLHDLHVAYTSHMPHISSSLIVRSLMQHLSRRRDQGSIGPFIGRGFLDTTRVSAGSPSMWEEIVELNRKNISESLDVMIRELQDFRDLLDEDGGGARIHELFSEIKKFRSQFK